MNFLKKTYADYNINLDFNIYLLRFAEMTKQNTKFCQSSSQSCKTVPRWQRHVVEPPQPGYYYINYKYDYETYNTGDRETLTI
jgi:hypothetical protein